MPSKKHEKTGGPKAGAKAEAHAVRDEKGPAMKSHPKSKAMRGVAKRLEGKAL